MIAVVWHSRTGAAEAMAAAISEGLAGSGRLIRAQDVSPADLLEADGFLFVCPENLASMTGMMKEMFDRCYYSLLGRVEGRPYATAIVAGSDGLGAEAQIDRIATGWRLKRIADSLIVNVGAQTPTEILANKEVAEQELARCNLLGATIREGMDLGIF